MEEPENDCRRRPKLSWSRELQLIPHTAKTVSRRLIGFFHKLHFVFIWKMSCGGKKRGILKSYQLRLRERWKEHRLKVQSKNLAHGLAQGVRQEEELKMRQVCSFRVSNWNGTIR